jgi:hypothetical protein
MGFREGLADGGAVARHFGGADPSGARAGRAPLALLFRCERGALDARFAGALRGSVEASGHVGSLGRAAAPSCFVSAGYAAGWYSAVLGASVLVRETECAACRAEPRGDCRFEARPLEDWQASDAAWLEGVLPFVDFESPEPAADAAGEKPEEADGDEPAEAEGTMLGSFDPLSPAIHVWGPVIVIPYAGAADGEEALEVISRDLGRGTLRAAVVDVTGARVEGVERMGLVRLLAAIDARGLCAVVAGAPQAVAGSFERDEPNGGALWAPDVTRAIALAFQLSGASAVS